MSIRKICGKHARRLPLLGLTAILCSCASMKNFWQDKPLKAATQEEAGSTHIAVLSVALWDDYRQALQPKFALTPGDALVSISRANRRVERLAQQQNNVGINLQGPQSTSSGTNQTNTTSTNSDKPVTTTTTTTATASGPATALITENGSTTRQPSIPARNVVALPTTIVGDVNTAETLGINSALQYTAAAALFQEVQLINRYVEDAVRVSGMQPYVVRMQISVLPSARRRPYDAYVNLSFFPKNASDKSQVMSGSPTTRTLTFRSARVDPMPDNSSLSEDASTLSEGASSNLDDTAEVVPLLVTDDLESTLATQSEERLAQLSLGLSLLQNNIGANVGLENRQRALRKIFGRDINSLVTVARLNRNTFRVRLGAMGSSQPKETMVPRTYNLTMLLMVPCSLMGKPRPTVQVRGLTEFADVDGGTILASRQPDTNVLRHLWMSKSPALAKFAKQQSFVESYLLMRTHISLGNIKDFFSTAGDVCNKDRECQQDIYRQIANELVGSNTIATDFEVPRTSSPALAQSTVSAPNLVIQGAFANARWLAGEDLRKTDLIASLKYYRLNQAMPIEVLANSIDTDDGRIVSAIFPSPNSLGLTLDSKKASQISVRCTTCTLRYRGDICSKPTTFTKVEFNDVALLEAPAEVKAALFTLRFPISSAKAEGGKLSLTAQLSYPDKQEAIPIFFDVSGADIASYTCAPACSVDGQHQLISGRGKLGLMLVNASQKVILLAGVKPGDLKPVGEIAVSK